MLKSKPFIKYLLFLLILGGSALFFYLRDKQKPINHLMIEFSQLDENQIVNITISDTTNQIRITHDQDGNWQVNNLHKLNMTRLGLIVETFRRIRLTSPVPQHLYGKILNSSNVKRTYEILLTDGNEKTVQFLFDTTENGQSFILLDKNDKLYRFNIPGYSRSDIFGFLPMNMSYWIDQQLFEYQSENIHKIVLRYLNSPEKSFFLEKDSVWYLGNEEGIVIAHQEKVMQYMSYFTGINEDNVISPGMNEILNPERLFARFEISYDTQRDIYTLYEISNEATKDMYHLYLTKNDSESVYKIKYLVMDPLLKKYSYFVN